MAYATRNLLAGERLTEHTPGYPLIWIDSPAVLMARPAYKARDEDAAATHEWVWGGYGRDATAAHLRAGSAPDALRDAFERERALWESRAEAIGRALPSRRRQRRYRDVGDLVEVGRYLSDRPDCWERLERGRSLPSVTLGLRLILSHGNKAPQFAALVARAAACSWALCSAGYAVRIVGVLAPHRLDEGRTNHIWMGGTAWTIKDYSDPLDVERVLSAGLPGLTRAWAFAQWDRVLRGNDGMGRVLRTTPEQIAALGIGADLWIEDAWSAPIGTSEAGGKLAQAFHADGFSRD